MLRPPRRVLDVYRVLRKCRGPPPANVHTSFTNVLGGKAARLHYSEFASLESLSLACEEEGASSLVYTPSWSPDVALLPPDSLVEWHRLQMVSGGPNVWGRALSRWVDAATTIAPLWAVLYTDVGHAGVVHVVHQHASLAARLEARAASRSDPLFMSRMVEAAPFIASSSITLYTAHSPAEAAERV